MSTATDATAPERAVRHSRPHPDCSRRPLDGIRAEFLEMPGLALTLAQAARLFGIDVRQAKQDLQRLLDERFLVRDARGAFRRRDVFVLGGAQGSVERWAA